MNPLEQKLRTAAPIPFREFMGAALFDPEHGYYTKHVRTVGRDGDFSTAPTLSPLLAKAVARWLRERWGDQRGMAHQVIEIGAGDGSLAAGIRSELGFIGRRGLRYHIVEASSPLAAAQRQRLAKHRQFRWHASMAQALDAAGGEALILSNELVDAFPAALIEWDAAAASWREIGLHDEAGAWSATAGAKIEPPVNSSLAGGHDFADGQRIERHDSFIEWLAGWLPHWRRGEMLTIDYGDTFPQVYHRRPRGTLRAYFAQQRFESLPEILARPGRQDITADIDFTDLQMRGEELGLETVRLETQAEFIARSAPTNTALAHADLAMRETFGAGGAFRVLWQRKPEVES